MDGDLASTLTAFRLVKGLFTNITSFLGSKSPGFQGSWSQGRGLLGPAFQPRPYTGGLFGFFLLALLTDRSEDRTYDL
jgi:hypothetical protein